MTADVTSPIRDLRVEDPTNTWIVDPLARQFVPLAARLRVPANVISFAGLAAGAASAMAFEHWHQRGWVALGLVLGIAWLVADSLDGMVARATGTASALGRELDGLCDHGVFAMLYIALARSVGGGIEIWSLVLAAALAHAIQANVYETERARFHRRVCAGAADPGPRGSRNPLVQLYDQAAAFLDRASGGTPAWSALPDRLRERYRAAAVPIFRMMLPLSQNLRLVAIVLACATGRITALLWYEIVPLSLLAALGLLLHHDVEDRTLRAARACG